MPDWLLWLGFLVAGTGALWLGAQALMLGSGLLERALAWLVFGGT